MTTAKRPEHDILNKDPIPVAIFGHWTRHGTPATVKDIAKETGWPPAKVRKEIGRYPGSAIPGCVFSVTSVLVSGTHDRRVDGWEPDLRTLRAVIEAQRLQIDELARQCGENHQPTIGKVGRG